MKENNTKNKIDSKVVLDSGKFIKFLPDTNTLFAYLNSNNQFHYEAKSSIDALNLKTNVWILVSHLSIGEFLSHRNLIGRGTYSIKRTIDVLIKFLDSLNRHLYGGVALNSDTIIKRYKKHSKHRKFTSAGFIDFMLLVQAEEISNARILTCDKNMYKCGKSVLGEKIYYLPNNSKDIKSDYPRLMLEIQNDFNKVGSQK